MGFLNNITSIFRPEGARTSQVDLAALPGPLISVVVPLYNTPIHLLDLMVASLTNQSYQKWELVLVNSTPGNRKLARALGKFGDSRVKVVTLEKNLGISGNTNAGIEVATGDFIAFLDHDDEISPNALETYARLIEGNAEIDVLYSDEDMVTEAGEYAFEHRKSDFNIDLLRCHNYITHFLCARASLVKDLKLNSELDGAQDWDLNLRLSENTKNFYHVRENLYHWRMVETSTAKDSDAKPYAENASEVALKEHLKREGLDAKVTQNSHTFFFRCDYEVEGKPKVETIYLKDIGAFDKSKLPADCDYLMFLNESLEPCGSDWLNSMIGFCQREDVGVVGAKLLNHENKVVNGAIGFTKKSPLPRPAFRGCARDDVWYYNRCAIAQDVLAVTGECMLVKKSLFDELGGFDDGFDFNLGAIDFCLRAIDAGKLVVYDANAELYYKDESSLDNENLRRIDAACQNDEQQEKFKQRWQKYYDGGDPYIPEQCFFG